MTPKEYKLAVRRSWVEDHFQQYGLTDEKIMAFLPLPSDNFTEGFRAGEEYARLNQWVSVDERLPELRERVLICERVGNQYKIFIGKRVPSPCPDGWEWNQSTKESVVAWMPLPQYQSEIAKEVEK